MSAGDDEAAPPRVRRRRDAMRFRVLLALAILVLTALFGVWLARVPIATGFIDRELAAKGVRGSYAIDDLGFGRQRLTNVVIGDPARPDLVADWIETVTDIGPGGARVTGVRAGQVRLRARIADRRLSLGALDRLLPPPSGAPFALPRIDVRVGDARVRLETPAGVVGLRVAGAGRLDDGFDGVVALAGQRLAAGGCAVRAPQAVLAVTIADGAPTLRGPVRAAAADCAGVRVAGAAATLDTTLRAALDRWSGQLVGRTGAIAADRVGRAAALAIDASFDGTPAATAGRLVAGAKNIRAVAITGERADVDLAYRLRAGTLALDGTVGGSGLALHGEARAAIRRLAGVAPSTPLAPLATRVAVAAETAASGFAARATIAARIGGGGGAIDVAQVSIDARSGAAIRARDIAWRWPDGGIRVGGDVTVRGGGLPEADVRIAQASGGRLAGTLVLRRPYATGNAWISATPVTFATGPAGGRAAGRVTLSGPLADGRVDGLVLPVDARWDARGRIAINPGCTTLAFDRLALAGLALRPARIGACPVGDALVTVDDGRIGGGARLARTVLAGTLGGSPLTVSAAGARVTPAGLALEGVAARIGQPERATRLDVARLDGRFAPGTVAGRFAGAGGQIGTVPLVLSEAAGDWRFARGALDLRGTMTVADAAPDARFRPLAARDVALTLARGQIAASGTLTEPAKGVKVADVTLTHTLADGRGVAHLSVPGITFGDGFQPEELTRLTFGVIADVKGSVRGEGDIAWNPDGVTSTGRFTTDGTDLAAAFGPVTGIRGTIVFTDLLNLESAPGQVATVASINPGVAVTDGRIVYRTLPGNRVQVDSGRWPFAGGTLTLEPTLLDFSTAAQRRLTFRVAGMEAAQFLQQFDFENIDATGVFDGVLPMVFDDGGGRIENGKLTVRPGGGTLAYVGELTEKDLGTWGNIAFQALKSLRYRELDVVMNGPLAGEMVTQVRFAGVNQGAGAKSNFLIRRLQKLPFVFNIRITAPFRGLIDSAASFYDPKRLIERNLPALLEEQNRRAAPPTIQPPASEIVK